MDATCCAKFIDGILSVDRFVPARGDKEEEYRQFLIGHGVLPKQAICERCGQMLKYRKSRKQYVCHSAKRHGNGVRDRCQYNVTEKSGTFCQRSRLSFSHLVFMAYMYIKKDSNNLKVANLLQVDENVVNQWTVRLGEVLTNWQKSLPPIGGEGIEVVIDETTLMSARQSRSKHQKENANLNWFVCGVECHSRKRFVVNMENSKRTANHLEQLIQAHVLPGSVIYTDKFKTYSDLEALGYEHHVLTGDNRVELTHILNLVWTDMKQWVIKRGNSCKHLKYHLARYLFVSAFSDDAERFHHLMLQCGFKFPPRAKQCLDSEELKEEAV